MGVYVCVCVCVCIHSVQVMPRRTPLFGLGGSIPKPVKFPVDKIVVEKVACGDSHTLAIAWDRDTSFKGVYSWGRGASYRLGHGTDQDEPQPRLIEDSGVCGGERGEMTRDDPLDISCGSGTNSQKYSLY